MKEEKQKKNDRGRREENHRKKDELKRKKFLCSNISSKISLKAPIRHLDNLPPFRSVGDTVVPMRIPHPSLSRNVSMMENGVEHVGILCSLAHFSFH